MLTAFVTELNSTQSELEVLLAKVELLRVQMKSLKTAQNKVLKVVDNLKNLVAELPEVAINELKKEILSLFPSDPEPIKEPAPVTEVFNNFVTEVPKAEEAQPWNPTHFEPLEFQAEDNGQLNLFQPTTTEPPEPDDFLTADNVIDLSAYWEAWAEWEKTNRPVKAATAPVEEETTNDDDEWPEVEPAPKTTDNDYAQTEYLNDTVCYIKKYDGEILAAYLGTATKKLTEEWADLLILWGCNATARKAERLGKGIRWEVKITKIAMEQLITVANNHPGLYSGVPQGNSEYTKKSTTGKEKIGENFSDSKTPAFQSNSQPESVEIITEKVLVAN